MAHIETFAYFPQHKYSYIDGKLIIEIFNYSVVMNLSGTLLHNVFRRDLDFHRDSITKCMNFLIGSCSSWPLDSFEFVCVGFENEAILHQQRMQNIFDCVGVLSLILHSLEWLSIVAKEESQFYFEWIAFLFLDFLILFN